MLFAVNDRVVEWWKRDEEGNICFHARIKLPAKTFPKVLSPRTEGFSHYDASWTLADIDGDGKIDEVAVEMQRQNPSKPITMLSITLSSSREFSLKLPYEMSFAVKDFDGDGQTEVFGWVPFSSDGLRLYCWDFDPKARRLVTVLREKVLHPDDLAFREGIENLAFIRSKDGFRWFLVPALKGGQKVIARWRIENGKWRRMEDIPLPNQNGFELLWVGDGLLAFEKRYLGITSLVLISIEVWLREMIAEFFAEFFGKRLNPDPVTTFTNLWVWKEGEGWRLLDRLTAEAGECPSCLMLEGSVTPYWITWGDLDGDGEDEILLREPRSWWIGQWKDGRWRKSRPIGGFTVPKGIIRDGKRRWLLGRYSPNRFIAVRIAE